MWSYVRISSLQYTLSTHTIIPFTTQCTYVPPDVPPYISTAGYVSMYKVSHPNLYTVWDIPSYTQLYFFSHPPLHPYTPYTHTYTHTLTPQYEEPCSKGPGYKWYLFSVYAFSEHAASIMKGHGFSKTDTKPTKILELMNEEGYVLGQAQIIVYYSLYGDEETETTTTTTTTATVATPPAGGGGGATPPAAGGGAPAVPGGAGAVAAPPGGGAPAPRIPAAGVAGGAVATAGGTGAAASAASVPPAV